MDKVIQKFRVTLGVFFYTARFEFFRDFEKKMLIIKINDHQSEDENVNERYFVCSVELKAGYTHASMEEDCKLRLEITAVSHPASKKREKEPWWCAGCERKIAGHEKRESRKKKKN